VDSRPRQLTCAVSEGFADWLARACGTVAVSTYQAGKLVLAGWNGTQVSVLPRDMPKPMGLAVNGQTVAVACRDEVVLYANASHLAPHYPHENSRRYDALYLPRAAFFTGNLDLHDMAFGPDGLWAVNTLFSCLSIVGGAYSFLPKWRPPFISQLVPEDRCHLNGMAMDAGRPRYVTAHGTSDDKGGWRAGRSDGGVLIDVTSGEFVLTGLSMPHSPRVRDGAVWLLNSGRGELLRVDPASGDSTVVCVLPGYGRGLCFVGDCALVGLSQVRSSHLFDGLGVQKRFDELHCGLAVVDLATGNNLGMLDFTEGCDELYDVHFIAGTVRPSILTRRNELARQSVTAPDFAYRIYEEEKTPGDSETAISPAGDRADQ
jgi:uncharacterized protein (TIGR03032 family)